MTLDGLEAPADPMERRVLDALGARSRSTADVARRAGLGVVDTAGALGMLALEGVAEQAVDGGWRRAGR